MGGKTNWIMPILLTFLGGYVDTSGYLSLQGLFLAHVTGNFVTLGASWALGTSGAVAKLLAIPVFCVGVMCTRLIGNTVATRSHSSLRFLFVLHFFVLTIGAVLAIRFGPFKNGDAWAAVLTGEVLVAAMSIQNAAHRIHLASTPPTTLMTGTTTQIMIDLADLLTVRDANLRAVARERLGRFIPSVAAFAIGCGAAAIIFGLAQTWCFALPPLLAACAIPLAAPDQTSV